MMIRLELSEQHFEVIARALANAPYGQVAPVIAELQRQINLGQPSQPPQGKTEKE